jgi:hypothetical protein
MAVAVMVVVAMMVVTRRPRVGRHGEHRQHGCDGKDFGERHAKLLSSVVNDRTGSGAGSCLKNGKAPDGVHRARASSGRVVLDDPCFDAYFVLASMSALSDL